MRPKKRTIILILLVGYFAFQQMKTPDTTTNECPQYINEFIKQNPQAIDLKINYQKEENNEPIDLKINDEIPLFIQWDKRWAYSPYGKEIIGTAGCGPTSLSMVTVGLTNNSKYNPRYVAKYAIKNGYLDGSKTTWSLMEKGCNAFGIKATEVPLDKNMMIKKLNNGNPIICSVRPGDFTSTGHFIVITKAINDQFCVNDPNSRENSQRTWSYKQLAPQIKAMWSYSLSK